MDKQEPFNSWWARNHPFDWYASENGGIPVGNMERLHIAQMAEQAYNAAVAPLQEKAELADRMMRILCRVKQPFLVDSTNLAIAFAGDAVVNQLANIDEVLADYDQLKGKAGTE